MRIFAPILLILLLTEAAASAQPAGNPTANAAQWLQHSRRAQDENKYAEAKICAQKAVDGFTHPDEPDSLGEALVMLWSSSSLSGLPYADRIPLLEKAAAAFERAANRRREADCLKEIADLQQITGNFSAAFLTLQNSLRLYQSANYPYLQGVYDLLCIVSGFLSEWDESIRYGLQAVRYAENTHDTSSSLCAYYNHLGMAYYGLKYFPQAQVYFSRSLDIARKYNDADGIVMVGCNLTRNYIYWDKPREALEFLTGLRATYPAFFASYQFDLDANMLAIYDRLGPPAKAAYYCSRLERTVAGKNLEHYKRAIGCMNLVYHYFTLRDYDKAETWLSAYSDIDRQTKVPHYIQNNLFWHFRLDSARGRFVSAIRYYQQWKQRADTILNENKSRQIEQYNALYESEKKDKSILLLQQRSQTQQTLLLHEQFLRKVTLGGIALLVLIIGLLFYTVRMKQRNNRLLQAQRSEIDRQNQSLRQLVTEKEWLVKEIHHRVKNNLHMVVGLLASQAEYLKGQEAHDAITESQHRVQAMSLIHQKLYNTETLSSIDMPHYVHELVDYLQDSFDTGTCIRFTLDIAKLSFPLSHSVPIGLILNEAITNAIKYAFPNGRKGHITISLQPAGADSQMPLPREPHSDPRFRLVVRDNGIGIPAEYRRHSSLGIALIEGLSKDIRGTLTIANDNGTLIALTFPVAQAVTNPITPAATTS